MEQKEVSRNSFLTLSALLSLQYAYYEHISHILHILTAEVKKESLYEE